MYFAQNFPLISDSPPVQTHVVKQTWRKQTWKDIKIKTISSSVEFLENLLLNYKEL